MFTGLPHILHHLKRLNRLDRLNKFKVTSKVGIIKMTVQRCSKMSLNFTCKQRLIVRLKAHTEITFKPADFCWSVHRIHVFCMRDLYEFAEQWMM